MLCEVPLTKEQQEFAAEHHGLVYKFLNDNHLAEDEFYDVVIFAYLKAVKDFFQDESAQCYTLQLSPNTECGYAYTTIFVHRTATNEMPKSLASTLACIPTALLWKIHWRCRTN